MWYESSFHKSRSKSYFVGTGKNSILGPSADVKHAGLQRSLTCCRWEAGHLRWRIQSRGYNASLVCGCAGIVLDLRGTAGTQMLPVTNYSALPGKL